MLYSQICWSLAQYTRNCMTSKKPWVCISYTLNCWSDSLILRLLIRRYSAPQSWILARRGTQRRSRGFSREDRENGVSPCLSVRFHPPFLWKTRANYDQRKDTTDQCGWSVTTSSLFWWQKAYVISFKVIYTSLQAIKKRDLSNQSWRSNKIH